MFAVQPNANTLFGSGAAGNVITPQAGGTLSSAQNAYLIATSKAGSPAGSSDGVSPNWWSNPGAGSLPGATNVGNSFFAVINNLMGQLNALMAQFSSGATSGGPGSQNVADATFASKGDPHLSEQGTLNGGSGTSPVNTHFDSMASHDNLLSSTDFDGGYRLSTTVRNPNAQGVTYNQSASVHLNNDADNVTVNNDGSYSIASNGAAVNLDKGQSAQLAGGETVSRNTDGSFTVSEQNSSGGSIVTTLAVNGAGVDATATVHGATIDGDISAHNATPPAAVSYA